MREIADFSSTFVVSEELVKNIPRPFKTSPFYQRFAKSSNRRDRSDETENEDNNWEELLLSGGLKSLYVFELDTHLKKHSLPYKKKIEK